MADMKETITNKLDVGIVSTDSPDTATVLSDTQVAVNQAVLQGLAALKARGFSSAKLTLTFKAIVAEKQDE